MTPESPWWETGPAEITPTADGTTLDCGGDRQTWGCGCPACLPRQHPLDLMARVSAAQLAQWAQARAKLSAQPRTRGSCYCGQPGRLYAGGFRCDTHVRQAPGPLSAATRDAIGSYVREHGTTPWPRKQKKDS